MVEFRMVTLSFAGIVTLCHAAFPATTASPSLSGPTRAFFPTPDGQIHYVHSGDLQTQTTLLLLHGHPRSITEYRSLVEDLNGRYAFVALDYFGFGSSDDCARCDPQTNQHVTVQQWGAYAVQVMDLLGIQKFAVVGSLKGTYTATYLSAHYASRVSATVLVLPCWLNSTTLKRVEGYMEAAKHPQLKADGSHLLTAWNDPSADGGLDTVHNEEKTLDNLRSMKDSWTYMWHMVDYNDMMLAGMESFKHKTLLVWGLAALRNWDLYGFETALMRPKIEKALKSSGANITVQEIENGSEGSMAQNSSTIASWLVGFLG